MEFSWKFSALDRYAENMFSPEFVSVNWTGVLAGLFLGLALVSCVYSAVFFGVLRQKFLLWYAARCTAVGVLALTLSPVYLGPFFGTDEVPRYMLGFLGFDLLVALSGPFIASILEPEAIPGRLRKLLFYSFPPALLFIPVYWMMEPPAVYYLSRLLYYCFILIAVIAAVVIAFRRGSRTARFQAAGWAPIILLNVVNLPYHIASGNPLPEYLTLLFITLGIECVVTVVGIADRFMGLRRERDRAADRESLLIAMAQTDPLTGLGNRRALEEAFGHDVTALAVFDLDNFKLVNDTFGHDVGDRVLVHTAHALEGASGLPVRLGGEEFAVLFTSGDAETEAETLREAIHREATNVQPGLIVTASCGLALLREKHDLRDVMHKADTLLYEAKREGRNRTIVGSIETVLPIDRRKPRPAAA